MKRASSKAKRQAVGRSVPTCCSTFPKLFSVPIPEEGQTPVAKPSALKFWRKSYAIFQYGGNFRICDRAGRKVNISPDDAGWLIEQLALEPHPDTLFRAAVKWSNPTGQRTGGTP